MTGGKIAAAKHTTIKWKLDFIIMYYVVIKNY